MRLFVDLLYGRTVSSRKACSPHVVSLTSCVEIDLYEVEVHILNTVFLLYIAN